MTIASASTGVDFNTEVVPAHASALIRRGFSYWMEKCAGREMPHRRDIDPIDLRRDLPNVTLMDVLDDPLDFMERVTGEMILHHNTCNYQNVPWRTLPERGPDSSIHKFFRDIVSERRPKFARIPYVGPHTHISAVEVFAGPLANDEDEVFKIIAFVDYLHDPH